MKKRNLKLNFNKQTIAKLEIPEQNLIKGASDTICNIFCNVTVAPLTDNAAMCTLHSGFIICL